MDEPSTGLDPASRNNLWNVVKRAKQNRAIILTSTFSSLTHFVSQPLISFKLSYCKEYVDLRPFRMYTVFFTYIILTLIICCFTMPDNYPLDSTFNGGGGASL